MRKDIKERIEMIQRGEIPKGYKITKNGIFPEKWEECKLRTKFKRVNRKNKESNDNVLTISAQNGLISQEEFFTKSVASEDKTNYYLLKKGEFAYNKSYSNGYPYGAIKQLEYYDKGIVSPLYICFSKINNEVFELYYKYYFDYGMLNKEINAFAQEGARNHGLLNIAVDDFFGVNMCIPERIEQEKIVKIFDLYQQKQELFTKLISQKKLQKKFCTQQLLTRKKRLKKFDYEWKKIKLCHVLKERKLYAQKGEQYPHVTLSTEGIYDKSERYDRDHLVKNEDKQYKVTFLNDICYNPANLKFGVVCRNIFGNAIFSPIYVTFEVNRNYDIEFISQFLMRWDFINAVRKYEEGTVYERMAVSPNDFLNFEVELPNLEEQKAIAIILSQADKEIYLLEKQLEQIKLEKKAIMQLLLTGIVRVNQKEGE